MPSTSEGMRRSGESPAAAMISLMRASPGGGWSEPSFGGGRPSVGVSRTSKPSRAFATVRDIAWSRRRAPSSEGPSMVRPSMPTIHVPVSKSRRRSGLPLSLAPSARSAAVATATMIVKSTAKRSGSMGRWSTSTVCPSEAQRAAASSAAARTSGCGVPGRNGVLQRATRRRPGSLPTSARKGPDGAGAAYGAPRSMPCVASSSAALSRTLRVSA